jgi:hypothetical protein
LKASNKFQELEELNKSVPEIRNVGSSFFVSRQLFFPFLTWKLVICLKYLVLFWLSAAIFLVTRVVEMLYVDVIDQSPRIVTSFISFSFRESLYDHDFSFSLTGEVRGLPQDMSSLFMGNK